MMKLGIGDPRPLGSGDSVFRSIPLRGWSNSGDLLRGAWDRSERVDLTRFKACTEMVWPAAGEAITVVPGIGVGGGDELSERNNG